MAIGRQMEDFVPGLWKVGTHLSLNKRPPGELDTLPAIWADFIKAFHGQHPVFDSMESMVILSVVLVKSTPEKLLLYALMQFQNVMN